MADQNAGVIIVGVQTEIVEAEECTFVAYSLTFDGVLQDQVFIMLLDEEDDG